jgi:hypothetical protein
MIKTNKLKTLNLKKVTVTKYVMMCVTLIFPMLVNAGEWEDRRNNLDNVKVVNHFRIFYSLTGRDALPNARQVDKNNNNVPDFIDEIGVKLGQADRFFMHRVKLRPPLMSRRYRGKAKYIDINVLDFSTHKKGSKNGVAYDGTPYFDRSIANQISSKVITMDVASTVRFQSNSIEHELFHLYQNGYTFFKNRWYTEGTARWSELIMSKRLGNVDSLPKTTKDKEALFNKTYKANGFWNKLIEEVDKKSTGIRFINVFLNLLDEVDNEVAKVRGLNDTYWKESEQRSKQNNDYIWEAGLSAAILVSKDKTTKHKLKMMKKL